MIRAYEKKDTIEVVNLARNAFARNDAAGYYEQPGLPALLDVFDASKILNLRVKKIDKLVAAAH